MASSLLDRVKRPPPSAETFIAAADAVPTSSTTSPPVGTPPQAAEPEVTAPNSKPRALRHAAQEQRKEDPRKHDVPRYTFNLRLNDYELELLRSLADEKRESMQKIVKTGLIPYLESLVDGRSRT
jgi:hypothetical protein